MIKKLRFSLLLAIIIQASYSQAPSNNNPCSAQTLTVNTSCTFATYTNVNATDSGIADPGCADYSGGDVWFSVTVPLSGSIMIDTDSGGITDSGMATYSGTCGTLALLECNDDGGTGFMSSITHTGLIPGTTIFIRVWEYGNNTFGTFDICVSEPPSPPSNDECLNATSLTVNTDFSCTNTTSGTTVSATASPQADDVTGTPNNDVWYSFVSTNTTHQVSLLNVVAVNGSSDMGIGVYDGSGTCAALVFFDDSDPNTLNLTGLTVGTTYYVRVYGWYNDSSDEANFDICIGTPPPPPSNDECTGAISVGVNNDDSCTLSEAGTISGATDSGEDNCFGSPDDDVWFSFVAGSTSHTIDIYNVFGTSTDMYHAVYESTGTPACDNLNNLTCSDPNSSTVSGLTVGNTYYVQVFTYTSSGSQNTDFRICIGTPVIPSNDDCADAIDLTVSSSCNFVTYTNENATDSTGVPAPGCASYQGGDVWFTVTVPPSGVVIIDSNVGDITDSGMAVYSGTCGSLSLVECDDDDSSNGFLMSYINLTGQTPGDTLYIRFWEYGNNNNGEFDICVSTVVPPGTNGANISCPGDSSTTLSTDLTCALGGVDFLGYGSTVDASYSSVLNGGPTALRPITFIDDADGCAFDSSITSNYTTVDFTVNTDGTYVFTSESDFDAMGYIVIDDGTWSAGTCPGTWTWITGDDDNGPPVLQAEMTANLQTGITYTMVTTIWSSSSTVATNEPFTWHVTTTPREPDWYDAPTGGTLVGTGAFFDPVTDGPLTDTNTPGVYSYWADDCSGGTRERADFVIGKLWDGSTDNNWNIAANWTPSGIPTANDCVYIRAASESTAYDIITNSNAIVGPPMPPAPGGFARQFTVNTGATFELQTSHQLTVTDEITVNGSFDIRDSANLVQVTDVTTNLNTGSVSMHRTPDTTINPYDYVYWSSPVDNFTAGSISYNTTSELIWKWIPSISNNYGNWNSVSEGEIMMPGEGYIVRGLETDTSTPTNTTEFFGRPRNGIVQLPISRGTYGTNPGETGYINPINGVWVTPEDDNWNLIGNPYPSAISYSDFINYTNISVSADNTIIDGTIYLWTHQQFPDNTVDPFYDDFGANYYDDYISNNFTGPNPPASFNGNIGSGQAFFVLMLDNASQSEDITFSNTMRHATYANDVFYRTSEGNNSNNATNIEKHRIWLNLVNSEHNAITLLVGYIEGATNGNDRLYEGYNFGSVDFNFYSLIEDDRFSIQGKELPFDENDTIPLGISVSDSGIYKIAINTVDGVFEDEQQAIYLEDTYTNTIHDLRMSPYSFTSETGTLGIDDFDTTNGITVYDENETIVVKSDYEMIQSIEVYDVLGRNLFTNTSVNSDRFYISSIKPSELTLFLKIRLTDGRQKIAKIIF